MECEIQLRTVLQDAWSQVFHDRQYKSNMVNTEIPSELTRETNLVSGALELSDNEIGRLVKQYGNMAERINNAVYQELLDQVICQIWINIFLTGGHFALHMPTMKKKTM